MSLYDEDHTYLKGPAAEVPDEDWLLLQATMTLESLQNSNLSFVASNCELHEITNMQWLFDVVIDNISESVYMHDFVTTQTPIALWQEIIDDDDALAINMN